MSERHVVAGVGETSARVCRAYLTPGVTAYGMSADSPGEREGVGPGGDDHGWEEVRDGDLLDLEQAERDADQQHATGRAERCQMSRGQDVAQQRADRCCQSLDHQYDDRGGGDAPAQGRGEGSSVTRPSASVTRSGSGDSDDDR
jgi:hypothetical protein